MTRAILLLTALAATAGAQTLPARRSSNYDPNRRNGRFDLRAQVDGSVDFYIRGGEIRYRVRSGAPPRDEGSEYSQEIPRGELVNLQLEQRDGRNPIRIVEEPSRRNNYTLVLAVDDPQGGSARYHARITWDDCVLRSPFGRENNPGRGRDWPRGRDEYDSRILSSPPREGACLYTDTSFRGDFFCLQAGDSLDRIPPRFSGRIRSIQLFGRTRARVYRDAGMRGESTPIEFALDDTGRLRGRLERFESVVVERR